MEKQIKAEHLGKNIKYVRENICNMTQRNFSASVNISTEQLRKIEQGYSLPSVGSLFEIASFSGVPIDFLSRDDIHSSKLYSIIYLMKEINKYDNTFIKSIGDILLTTYSSLRRRDL